MGQEFDVAIIGPVGVNFAWRGEAAPDSGTERGQDADCRLSLQGRTLDVAVRCQVNGA